MIHSYNTRYVTLLPAGIVYGSNGKRVFSMNIDGSGFKVFSETNTLPISLFTETTSLLSFYPFTIAIVHYMICLSCLI